MGGRSSLGAPGKGFIVKPFRGKGEGKALNLKAPPARWEGGGAFCAGICTT